MNVIYLIKRGKSIDLEPYFPEENYRKCLNNCNEDADLPTGNNKSSLLESVHCKY